MTFWQWSAIFIITISRFNKVIEISAYHKIALLYYELWVHRTMSSIRKNIINNNHHHAKTVLL